MVNGCVGLQLITVLLILFTSVVVKAECAPGREVPNEYLIRVAEITVDSFSGKVQTHSTLEKIRNLSAGSKIIHRQSPLEPITNSGTLKSHNPIPTLVHAVINKDTKDSIERLSGVLSVEPNCFVDVFKNPNDAMFPDQWAHQVIQSEQAWEISTGSQNVIVAISDTGVDYNHEDLAAHMWVNDAELNGLPDVDDDSNGCVDDIYGCDTADNDGDPIPGRLNSSSHGTHVAGIVGAMGNNSTGVVGVSWNIKLMAVKGFFSAKDSTTSAALLESVKYAVDNGADVINCSWGSNSRPSNADLDMFQYAKDNGVVTVVAAGNSNQDSRDFSPAAVPHTLTVAASNAIDGLASFSNFGTIIDLMAPGGDLPRFQGRNDTILSTIPGNQYEGFVGTSMAAPYVAGLAGLILSINKDLNPDEVESILKDSADEVDVTVPSNPNLSYTYKRINAFKAAQMAKASLPQLPEDEEECEPGTQNCKASGSLRPGASKAILDGNGCGKFRAKRPEQNSAQIGAWILLLLFPIVIVILRKRR